MTLMDNAPLAQLVRAPRRHRGGRTFESFEAHAVRVTLHYDAAVWYVNDIPRSHAVVIVPVERAKTAQEAYDVAMPFLIAHALDGEWHLDLLS